MEAAKKTVKDVHSTVISELCPGAVTEAPYRDDGDAKNLDPQVDEDGGIELTTVSSFKTVTSCGKKKKVECFVKISASAKPRKLWLVIEMRGGMHINYHDSVIRMNVSRRVAENAAASMKRRLALL